MQDLGHARLVAPLAVAGDVPDGLAEGFEEVGVADLAGEEVTTAALVVEGSTPLTGAEGDSVGAVEGVTSPPALSDGLLGPELLLAEEPATGPDAISVSCLGTSGSFPELKEL